MIMHNGLYKISTQSNNSRFFVGLSHDPEPASVIEGVPVVVGPAALQTIVEVRGVEEDRYHLQLWYHSGLGLGYKSAETQPENEVIGVSEAGEWTIEEGSQPNCYRVKIPDTDLYWTVAPGVVDATPIALHPLEGKPAEEWTFEVQSKHE